MHPTTATLAGLETPAKAAPDSYRGSIPLQVVPEPSLAAPLTGYAAEIEKLNEKRREAFRLLVIRIGNGETIAVEEVDRIIAEAKQTPQHLQRELEAFAEFKRLQKIADMLPALEEEQAKARKVTEKARAARDAAEVALKDAVREYDQAMSKEGAAGVRARPAKLAKSRLDSDEFARFHL
jgi:hypothetical protein